MIALCLRLRHHSLANPATADIIAKADIDVQLLVKVLVDLQAHLKVLLDAVPVLTGLRLNADVLVNVDLDAILALCADVQALLADIQVTLKALVGLKAGMSTLPTPQASIPGLHSARTNRNPQRSSLSLVPSSRLSSACCCPSASPSSASPWVSLPASTSRCTPSLARSLPASTSSPTSLPA